MSTEQKPKCDYPSCGISGTCDPSRGFCVVEFMNKDRDLKKANERIKELEGSGDHLIVSTKIALLSSQLKQAQELIAELEKALVSGSITYKIEALARLENMRKQNE